MIEVIAGYTGESRAQGRIKMTLQYLYRCTKCELIKPEFLELKNHPCEVKKPNFWGY